MGDTERKTTPYFDKNTTLIIKGICIIFMFLHHFFTFPKWWGSDVSYPFFEMYGEYFRIPLKICVPVFCFITGYFYFFNKEKTIRYSLKKILDILITYWVVFFLFVLIAVSFADYEYLPSRLLLESFALINPTMRFNWYVIFYIFAMLLLPLLSKVMLRNPVFDVFFIVFISAIFASAGFFVENKIISDVLEDMFEWYPVVLTGYFVAGYGLFDKFHGINKKLVKNDVVNVLLWILIILLSCALRGVAPCIMIPFFKDITLYMYLDFIYATLFIYAIANIIRSCHIKALDKSLAVLGKYSLLMWLVSCIFFSNCKEIFRPILYFPHNPVLVTVWGLGMCLAASVVLDFPISFLKKIFHGKRQEKEKSKC